MPKLVNPLYYYQIPIAFRRFPLHSHTNNHKQIIKLLVPGILPWYIPIKTLKPPWLVATDCHVRRHRRVYSTAIPIPSCPSHSHDIYSHDIFIQLLQLVHTQLCMVIMIIPILFPCFLLIHYYRNSMKNPFENPIDFR